MGEQKYKVIKDGEIVTETNCATTSVTCFVQLSQEDVDDMADMEEFSRVLEWNDGKKFMRHTVQCGKM